MNYGFIYKATLPNKKVVLERFEYTKLAGLVGFDPTTYWLRASRFRR